jgi:hypothetical protein
VTADKRRITQSRCGRRIGSQITKMPLSCTDGGGPGWDRTSDLPRVKRSFGLHRCVSAGQTGSSSLNWPCWTNSSAALAAYWPHGLGDPTMEDPSRR